MSNEKNRFRCCDCLEEPTCGMTKFMQERFPGVERSLGYCVSYKPKTQVYTVNVWLKDSKGSEHEKNFQFNSREMADVFSFNAQTMLTKLRKTKAIRLGVVKVTPSLPR